MIKHRQGFAQGSLSLYLILYSTVRDLHKEQLTLYVHHTICTYQSTDIYMLFLNDYIQ